MTSLGQNISQDRDRLAGGRPYCIPSCSYIGPIMASLGQPTNLYKTSPVHSDTNNTCHFQVAGSPASSMGSSGGLSPLGGPRTPMVLPIKHESTVNMNLAHVLKTKLTEVLAIPDASTIIMECKTQALCSFYNTLIPEEKNIFLKMLAMDYGVDQSCILHLATSLQATQDKSVTQLLRAEDRLRHVLIPRYQHLFTQISRLEAGVKFLVDLRTDILSLLSVNGRERDNPYLQTMSVCLRDLLSLWFSVGFLQLQRITWSSPCDMLQKISEYEAVHPIRNWTDLKRRVGPYRRCFVFTHASMPHEPVVVLHSALTSEISNSIQSILQHTRYDPEANMDSGPPEKLEDASTVTTAIFYSITSTQRGLQGVELGNYIIKNVVRELQAEFPNMQQFSSLSPVPGFKDWLVAEINKQLHLQDIGERQEAEQTILLEEERAELTTLLGCPPKKSMLLMLKKTLQTNAWIKDENLMRALQHPLMRLCARYLYLEKRRGYSLNPVANFHLRNGAMMWRLNWLADTTPRGLGASCTMMVNYRYFLDQTEVYSQRYMETQEIPVSEQVLELVRHCSPITSPSSSSQSS